MTTPVLPDAGPDLERELIDWVAADFGLHLDRLIDIEGGLDASARVWQGQDAAGGLWCIKVNSRDVRFGLRLSGAASAARVPGVAAPRLSHSGEGWSSRSGRLLSVSPWVDGLDGVDGGADSVPWKQLGQTLRALHDMAPPPGTTMLRRGIRRQRHSPRSLLERTDRMFEAREGVDDDPWLHAAAGLWRRHRQRLVQLADWEREQKRLRTPAHRVPVHGDPHLGNIVMDASQRAWLIDFDEATVAPREVDLMLVELGVITAAPTTERQRAAFRRGYGTDVVIDDSRITRFACVRAIEDVASTAGQLLGLPASATHQQRADLLGALGDLFGPAGLIAQTEHRIADRLAAAPAPSRSIPFTAPSDRGQ